MAAVKSSANPLSILHEWVPFFNHIARFEVFMHFSRIQPMAWPCKPAVWESTADERQRWGFQTPQESANYYPGPLAVSRGLPLYISVCVRVRFRDQGCKICSNAFLSPATASFLRITQCLTLQVAPPVTKTVKTGNFLQNSCWLKWVSFQLQLHFSSIPHKDLLKADRHGGHDHNIRHPVPNFHERLLGRADDS